MAQHFINIGAKYGNVNIEQVLPCLTTNGRHLWEVIETEKLKLTETFTQINRFSITCDEWTHNTKNIKYVTVTT